MNTRRYVYDPRRMVLLVFDGQKNIGGYIGRIAEHKFERLLMTDCRIELGEFLTSAEKIQRQQNDKYSLNH